MLVGCQWCVLWTFNIHFQVEWIMFAMNCRAWGFSKTMLKSIHNSYNKWFHSLRKASNSGSLPKGSKRAEGGRAKGGRAKGGKAKCGRTNGLRTKRGRTKVGRAKGGRTIIFKFNPLQTPHNSSKWRSVFMETLNSANKKTNLRMWRMSFIVGERPHGPLKYLLAYGNSLNHIVDL